jgi:acetyl esterase/lipase
MVPTNDALRDESFQFALRLYKQGVDVRVKEYEFMPHGFLNYNAMLLGMRDESNVTINKCAHWIRFMLEK